MFACFGNESKVNSNADSFLFNVLILLKCKYLYFIALFSISTSEKV